MLGSMTIQRYFLAQPMDPVCGPWLAKDAKTIMTINVNTTTAPGGYIFEYETYMKAENGTFVGNSLELKIDPLTVINAAFRMTIRVFRASVRHLTSR